MHVHVERVIVIGAPPMRGRVLSAWMARRQQMTEQTKNM